MTYSDKLKDPRWQKKRLEIMQRDGFQCVNCHDKEKMLNVHHIRYDKKGIWHGDDHYKITLCESCHKLAEETKRQFEEMVSKLGVGKSYDILLALWSSILDFESVHGHLWPEAILDKARISLLKRNVYLDVKKGCSLNVILEG